VLQGGNTLKRGRAARRRVLIVEDEPYVRDAIATYLEKAGYEVDEAGSGIQALERMRSAMPDLVLLDLGLPVMSGPDFVAAVRQEPRLASAAVVVLSGQSDLTDEVAHLGARASLAKPIDLDILLAVVDRVSQT
jgi:DNA-binding response OmpR family regulator